MVTSRKIKLSLLSILFAVCTSFLYANVSLPTVLDKSNPVILDYADLLTDQEEANLSSLMSGITEYGGVAFITNPSLAVYEGYAADLAEYYCYELFNGESATVFLIDMYNRRIEIYSTGDIYKVITKGRANGIADNIYSYATDGNYYDCAANAFNQILTILEGGKVAVPMRYATNFLLAVGLVLFFVYLLTMKNRANYNFNQLTNVVIDSERSDLFLHLKKKTLISESRTVHVSSSSSGGGHSGGGHSGGGHSGGGGGHSF